MKREWHRTLGTASWQVRRPRRAAQMPPCVVIQYVPVYINVQQAPAQRMGFMPQQPNGRMPQVHHQQGAPQQPNGHMPEVHHHQCPQRNIILAEPLRRRNNHDGENGIAEQGMRALPLRRSERIRAQKEAKERVEPLQALRRSARIQAMREAEQREAQQLRRNTRNRAY